MIYINVYLYIYIKPLCILGKVEVDLSLTLKVEFTL